MNKLNQKIGLIGSGNMGSAILAGLLRNKITRPQQIFVYDPVTPKARAVAKKFRVSTARSNLDLIRKVKIILLAVKPQDLSSVAREIQSGLRSNQILISILAGTPVQKLKRFFGNRVNLVRAMPNLGAQVGESMTAITSSSRSALKVGESVFSGSGKVIKISERHFDLVTAVSGSGPAYFFLLMELLEDVARQSGISEKNARLLAVQTAFGAGKLAKTSSDSPAILRQKVTSKKGTTEAALRFLMRKGFSRTFQTAVRRAQKRARELSHI